VNLRHRRYRRVLVTLLSVFGIYNCLVYTDGTPSPRMPASAVRGEVLWQENNCVACHQLYGLGGYMGPDLTNIISAPGKGAEYAKAFLNSGIKSMPQFSFDEVEREHIIQFLTAVDQTGYYPNNGAKFTRFGWLELEYKESKELF